MTQQPQVGTREVDVVVIGGGQAGLSTGYYLRRAGLTPGEDFLIVDAAGEPGGAWPRMWDGLRLFSPSTHSSLPGRMMPPWDDAARGFPPRRHVVEYLAAYETRYQLPILRPVRVDSVRRADDDPRGRLEVAASGSELLARIVVSATGTWNQPYWPRVPGMGQYGGRQLHTVDYRMPQEFAGQRVAIVGGGNSAAQILAEVSQVADALWLTSRPPRFLPDHVDGRVLFAEATKRVRAIREGGERVDADGLGDIVMVPEVRAARDRGVLHARPMCDRLTRTGVAWANGEVESVDTVIWCTGFRPAIRHLAPLGLRDSTGHIAIDRDVGTQARGDPRVFLVGYGDWTGAASATLLGVGRTAARTVSTITDLLGS